MTSIQTKQMVNLLNSNLNQEKFTQKMFDAIANEEEITRNFWAELASVICCDRSDVYLRSLCNKVRKHYNPSVVNLDP